MIFYWLIPRLYVSGRHGSARSIRFKREAIPLTSRFPIRVKKSAVIPKSRYTASCLFSQVLMYPTQHFGCTFETRLYSMYILAGMCVYKYEYHKAAKGRWWDSWQPKEQAKVCVHALLGFLSKRLRGMPADVLLHIFCCLENPALFSFFFFRFFLAFFPLLSFFPMLVFFFPLHLGSALDNFFHPNSTQRQMMVARPCLSG